MHNQSRSSAASCFSSDKVIQAPAAITLFPPLPGTKGRGSGTLSPLFLFHLCISYRSFFCYLFMCLIEILCFCLLNVGLSRVSVGQMRLSASRPDQISWNLLYFDLGVGAGGAGEAECLDCFCSVFNILRQLTQPPPASCTHTQYDGRL